MTREAEFSRCPVVADQGTAQEMQCVNPEHPDTPDAHDFVGASAEPSDGGRNWAEWIRAVRRVQALLVDEQEEVMNGRGQVIAVHRYGLFPVEEAAHELLADIARAVGLDVHLRSDGTPQCIVPQGGAAPALGPSPTA